MSVILGNPFPLGSGLNFSGYISVPFQILLLIKNFKKGKSTFVLKVIIKIMNQVRFLDILLPKELLSGKLFLQIPMVSSDFFFLRRENRFLM